MKSRMIAVVALLGLCAMLASCACDGDKTARPLCDACSKMAFTADIGTCEDCSGTTSSGAFELCDTCAVKAGVCKACGTITR